MSDFLWRLLRGRLLACRCDPFTPCEPCKSDRALARKRRGPSLSGTKKG